MVFPPAVPRIEMPDVRQLELSAGPYLAEARRRLSRLVTLDLSRPRARRAAGSSAQWAEVQRWRLAEAWRRAQVAMHGFERHLSAAAAGRGDLPADPTPERFKAILLTHYGANILRYQAALGSRPGVPARPVPVEWMQMAAAAAIVSVIQTALMLWVLHRSPTAPRRQRTTRRWRLPVTVPRAGAVPRAASLPLRL